MSQPYPGQPAGPPQQWGPGPVGPSPYGYPPAPPGPPSRRGAPVGVVVGAVAVVVLVLVATTALVVRSLAGDDDDRLDFGAGPSSEPSEAWSIDLADDLDRTSVLSDGSRVYAVTTVEDEEDFTAATTVTAYAAGDGTELWSEEVDDGGSSDPLRLLGDEVLLHDSTDETDTVRLLDAATGEEVWEADGEPTDSLGALGIGLQFDVGALDPLLLTVDDDTIVAIDRASGDDLWDADAEDALPCGADLVLTYTNGESDDDDSFTPTPGDVTMRAIDSGEELWSTEAFPGSCDGGRVALGTDHDEVTVRDAASGDEVSRLDLAGDGRGSFVYAFPFGDHVAVTRFGFDDGADASAAVFPIEGGDPTWEETDVSVFPVGDGTVLTGDDEEARLIRASDGEELGRVDVDAEDNECDGALSARTIVVCDSASPDVTSYALDSGFDELWTVDVGFDVSAVALGGDTLFAIDDGELTAFR